MSGRKSDAKLPSIRMRSRRSQPDLWRRSLARRSGPKTRPGYYLQKSSHQGNAQLGAYQQLSSRTGGEVVSSDSYWTPSRPDPIRRERRGKDRARPGCRVAPDRPAGGRLQGGVHRTRSHREMTESHRLVKAVGPRLQPPCALRSDRPKPACRKMILDGDHRSDGRCPEIRACSSAESPRLSWRSEVAVSLRAWTITTPCARAPRRDAEPKNFPIGIAHSWSWAIGSSTGAAQRSFDGVVSRR
jgi:hypothetical protein